MVEQASQIFFNAKLLICYQVAYVFCLKRFPLHTYSLAIELYTYLAIELYTYLAIELYTYFLHLKFREWRAHSVRPSRRLHTYENTHSSFTPKNYVI